MLPTNRRAPEYSGAGGALGTVDAADQRADRAPTLVSRQARAAVSTEQQLPTGDISVSGEEGVRGMIERVSVIIGDEVQADVAAVAEEMEYRHPLMVEVRIRLTVLSSALKCAIQIAGMQGVTSCGTCVNYHSAFPIGRPAEKTMSLN